MTDKNDKNATFEERIAAAVADLAAGLKPTAARVKATASLNEACHGTDLPAAAEIEPMIAAGADVNAPNKDGMPFLLWVLSHEYNANDPLPRRENLHALLQLAMQAGPGLAARTAEGLAATDLAARWDDNGLALKILDAETRRRADPYLRSRLSTINPDWPKPGDPATDETKKWFMIWCQSGSFDEICYHLHIYPDAKDWYSRDWQEGGPRGLTGLIAAVSDSDVNLPGVNMLLAAGCNVNATDDDGQTALHKAATIEGNPRILQALIDAGADATLRDNAGKTAFERAADLGFDDKKAFLEEAFRATSAAKARRLRIEQNALNARLTGDKRRHHFRL